MLSRAAGAPAARRAACAPAPRRFVGFFRFYCARFERIRLTSGGDAHDFCRCLPAERQQASCGQLHAVRAPTTALLCGLQLCAGAGRSLLRAGSERTDCARPDMALPLKVPTAHVAEHGHAALVCLDRRFNELLPNTTPVFHDSATHAAVSHAQCHLAPLGVSPHCASAARVAFDPAHVGHALRYAVGRNSTVVRRCAASPRRPP